MLHSQGAGHETGTRTACTSPHTTTVTHAALRVVALEAFGYTHEISAGQTPGILFTSEEVHEFMTCRYVTMLSGFDDEIEHVLDVFDLAAIWTEAGECLIFSETQLGLDVLEECAACFISVDVEKRRTV